MTIRTWSPVSQLQLLLTDDGGGVEVVPVLCVAQDHLQLGEGLQQAVLAFVLSIGEHAEWEDADAGGVDTVQNVCTGFALHTKSLPRPSVHDVWLHYMSDVSRSTDYERSAEQVQILNIRQS